MSSREILRLGRVWDHLLRSPKGQDAFTQFNDAEQEVRRRPRRKVLFLLSKIHTSENLSGKNQRQNATISYMRAGLLLHFAPRHGSSTPKCTHTTTVQWQISLRNVTLPEYTHPFNKITPRSSCSSENGRAPCPQSLCYIHVPHTLQTHLRSHHSP